MSAYRRYDQQSKLGPRDTWNIDDPALVEWEKEHGHDVRLKCEVEFGCRMIEAELEEARKLLIEAQKKVASLIAWESLPVGWEDWSKRVSDFLKDTEL